MKPDFENIEAGIVFEFDGKKCIATKTYCENPCLECVFKNNPTCLDTFCLVKDVHYIKK